MASVLFGNTIDMITVATPSSGYVVAYDLDGILKQKDEFGVITEIGGGPTAGMGLTPSLSEVLNTGNISDGSDIVMSNDDVIISATGGALLNLRNGGNGSVVLGLPSSTYGGKGGEGDGGAVLFLDTSGITLGLNGGDYSKPYLYLTTQYSQMADYSTHSSSYYGFNMYRNSSFNNYSNGISIKENVTFSFTSINKDNYSVIIASRNSTTNAGVYNSPIIGGQSLNATQSNTVYLGNSVNINNAYTLPNLDGSNGQILTTDGNGNIIWDNSVVAGLEEVLSVNNDSGIYSILMGTGTSITSLSGGQIELSSGATNSVIISTDYGNLNKSYIRLDDSNITIESNDFNLGIDNAVITTSDLRGLVYAFDYSSTFVTQSLVDKNYVDNIFTSTSNFANTNLTFTGNREHDLNGSYLFIGDYNEVEYPYFGVTPFSTAYLGYISPSGSNEISVNNTNISLMINGIQKVFTSEFETLFNRTTFSTHNVRIKSNADDNLFLTDSSSNRIGIGTSSPSYKLHVIGTVSTTGFRMTDGAQDGYVLTSDSSGNAAWTAPIQSYIYSTFSISSTEILSLGETPINLLPQPGTNSYYDIHKIIIEYKYNTTGYSFNNIEEDKIFIFAGEIPIHIIDCRLLSDQDSPITGDRFIILNNSIPIGGSSQSGEWLNYSFPIAKNSDISISTSVNPENGDGSLFIKMWYSIEEFN